MGENARRGRESARRVWSPRRVPMWAAGTLIAGYLGCQRDEPPPVPRATLAAGERVELHNRGVGMMGQFDYDGAVRTFEQLLASTERDPSSQVDLAIALLNRRTVHDLARSALLLDEVIEADPTNLRAAYCRALLLFHDGQTAAARALFERVSSADPSDSFSIYYVGQTHFNEGEYAAAQEHFQQAQQIDPYLRSAYYGAFQAAQRLGQRQLAEESLAMFQRLANNPRARLAELKYTRMGPKAVVFAVDERPASASGRPAGQVFAERAPLPMVTDASFSWRDFGSDDNPPNITVADIDGDGRLDLFVARAIDSETTSLANAVLLQRDDGFELTAEHPLAMVGEVNTALWGDLDDDGLVDVYLCRNGANQLWRQVEPGRWEDVTDVSQTAGGEFSTVDGACFDADHDGDLDLLLVNADGPNELLSNNRDGTFRPLGQELGIAGPGRGSRRVVLADLDGDDDADLVFLHNEPPHDVFINDRLWEYSRTLGESFQDFVNTQIWAAVAVDASVDGQVELITVGPDGILRWSPDDAGQWRSQLVSEVDDESSAALLALYDLDGDANLDVLLAGERGWRAMDLSGNVLADSTSDTGLVCGVMVNSNGPEIIGLLSGGAPVVWQAGDGRFSFVQLRMVGRKDRSAEMRSNSSGIGVRGAARIGARWVPLAGSRVESGPGQSLQPHSVGLAGAASIDFVQLLWPDGVSQTELNVAPGALRTIEETQRQAGSCPLVFAWNGERFEFVADLLGAGGIGFNLGRGEYYDPRPSENLLLPEGLLQPRSGRYEIKLGEPMEEICYFDAVRLVAYDLPPGWQMTLDERFGGYGPLPTGRPVFFQREIPAIKATNDRNADITASIAARDRRAAPLDRSDRRFVGLTTPHSVTLTFEQPLDTLANPVLVFDGWVEYAYSQSAFAAWQADEVYTEPTIEAQGDDGRWSVVAERFGYMAGTPRQGSVALGQLPAGTRSLRISTNMQIYWDRLFVADAEANSDVCRHELELLLAKVDDVGFSTRTIFAQRYPIYDYDCRPPLGDTRHPAGFYTEFGDALELVATTDDAVAIIGPGEEVHLEFTACDAPLSAGWTRRLVLEADGWCKDADLFTKDSGTVEPLPRRGTVTNETDNERRKWLHARYNTRYRSD